MKETNNGLENRHGAGVPLQRTGKEMDVVEKLEVNSVAEANYFFQIVKNRLLDVNQWGKIAGMSDFALTDKDGNPVHRNATGGDFIRIDIPGPGTKAGGGYDWVRIEEVRLYKEHDAEILSMRARPSENPAIDRMDTAHFLTPEATSTFQVKRFGNTIYAEEHGRNEVPNTDTKSIADNLRNSVVGWAASMGLSYPQWNSLVKGLLAPEAL